jgi:hypothetical protein
MFRTKMILALALTGASAAFGADAPEKADKKILTLAGARTVAAAAEAEAAKGGATPAFAIVDDGGHVLLLVRPETTFAADEGREARRPRGLAAVDVHDEEAFLAARDGGKR